MCASWNRRNTCYRAFVLCCHIKIMAQVSTITGKFQSYYSGTNKVSAAASTYNRTLCEITYHKKGKSGKAILTDHNSRYCSSNYYNTISYQQRNQHTAKKTTKLDAIDQTEADSGEKDNKIGNHHISKSALNHHKQRGRNQNFSKPTQSRGSSSGSHSSLTSSKR